ncbi:MAG: two-component system sensor histidine kinase NtrB [Hyphomicrobium sp.]
MRHQSEKLSSSHKVLTPQNSGIDFEHLLQALPHPILVLREDNTVAYANTAAEAFFSTSLSVLRRETLDALLGFSSPILNLVQQVRQTQETVNEYGILLHAPKLLFPKLIDVYAGFFGHTETHILLMLQQRNMAQMIERQLNHRAAARTVSGMAAILAHEIKNPLSGIRGAAQLLEPTLSDQDRSLTQLICKETDRIRSLVDRMEIFGDERPLSKTDVNIHDVLNHVVQLARSGFAKKIRIIEEYDPSLPALSGNRDKLIQAFLNLVKNASEALASSEDQGRILIQTAFRPGVRLLVPGSTVRVSLPLLIQIEDNGEGVLEQIRAHLFDPFVTTKHNGTGLGLALVAKIINDHGGIIEFESEPRKTVFRILLPLDHQKVHNQNNKGV